MNTQGILDDLKTICVMLGYDVESYDNSSTSGFGPWKKTYTNKGLTISTPCGVIRLDFYFIDNVFQVFNGYIEYDDLSHDQVLQIKDKISIVPCVAAFLSTFGGAKNELENSI